MAASALRSIIGQHSIPLHTSDSAAWRPRAGHICYGRRACPAGFWSETGEGPQNVASSGGLARLQNSSALFHKSSPGPRLCPFQTSSSRDDRVMRGRSARLGLKYNRGGSEFRPTDADGLGVATRRQGCTCVASKMCNLASPEQHCRSLDDANCQESTSLMLGVKGLLKASVDWWGGGLSKGLAHVGGVLVCGAVLLSPCSVAASSLDWSAMAAVTELPPIPTEFPALPDISPLDYEKFTLSNGLRVFLLEDHELGLVGGELLVNGGGKFEPPGKAGLARLAAAVQRSGGTVTHPAEVLDSKLDAMAARIEASTSVSEMNVGFRCLTEDLPDVMSLFSEVVREPLMPENKLDLSRSQFIGAIARRPDDAGGIVAREFNKILYGPESLYSRVAEIQTVRAVDREDLLAFHKKNFRPDRAILGVWGDFSTPFMKERIEQSFGNWSAPPDEVATEASALETGFSASPPTVFFINRPGLTQGYVRMGEFGTTLADPDAFALDVLNGILNGFGGLLFDEVRSREGLAYSVSGGWSPAVEHRGSFIAGGETRVQAIPQFVGAVKRVLRKVVSEPPNADLLARAKEKALNSFVFNFADSGAQLARVLSYDLFGIDQDFLFKYKEGVETTTAVDILKAAQRHLHPDSQPVLIVTDTRQLTSLDSAFNQPVLTLDLDYLSQSQNDSFSKK